LAGHAPNSTKDRPDAIYAKYLSLLGRAFKGQFEGELITLDQSTGCCGIALGAPFAALPHLHFSPTRHERKPAVGRQLPKLHVVGSVPIVPPWTTLWRNICTCMSLAPLGTHMTSSDRSVLHARPGLHMQVLPLRQSRGTETPRHQSPLSAPAPRTQVRLADAVLHQRRARCHAGQ